jgi:hypothetical protein
MNPDELKLEILKLATSERLCGGDVDRALEAARKLWDFVIPTRETERASSRRET